ncbi:MAG: S-layer homology domain-containing protein [Firmicutes bacterium]|nr:S-layer homology domain-containing protein [Bacillota bacterium]
MKKKMALLMALILTLGQCITFAHGNDTRSIPGHFEIFYGNDVLLNIPNSLSPGEVWTGKAVTHIENEGHIVITLAAWGAKYADDSLPLAGNGAVTIVDDLHNFVFLEDSQKGVGNISVNTDRNIVTWVVDQADIINGPAKISYIVYLDMADDDWETGIIYTTLGAQATFTPAQSNGFYWTMQETSIEAYSLPGVKWNNNGLNSVEIVDNDLRISIPINCGPNNFPPGQLYSAPNARWRDTLVVRTFDHVSLGTFKYHLYRTELDKAVGSMTWVVTIADLGGPGIHIQYEIVITNPGGNEYQIGNRTITSTNVFHRSFRKDATYPFGSSDLFVWVGDSIVQDLNVVGTIRLNWDEPPPFHWPLGDLVIEKEMTGYYAADWLYGSDTNFFVRLSTGASQYIVANPLGGNKYEYLGLVDVPEEATLIMFSVNNPANILGMPVITTGSALDVNLNVRYYIEEVFAYDTDRIQVRYSDGGKGFYLIEGPYNKITVTNHFMHGIGTIRVRKFLAGFPAQWGVDEDTVFYVRVWDATNENYLLFQSKPHTYIPDNANPDSYIHIWRTIGNDVTGLSELYDGIPKMELPLSQNEFLTLSNLWTGRSYEIREVRPLDSGDWEYVDPINDDTRYDWLTNPEWNWGVSYSHTNEDNLLTYDELLFIVLTNYYKYSSGNLTIRKSMSGRPDDWGVSPYDDFQAQLWNVPNKDNPENRYLLIFERHIHPVMGKLYRTIGYVGNDGTPNFYYKTDAEITYVDEVHFSIASPAVIVGLPVDEVNYQVTNAIFVKEIFPYGAYTRHITKTYKWNEESFNTNGVMLFYNPHEGRGNSLTINNHYSGGNGMLVIRKELAGSPEDWGVNTSTEFFAGVKIYGTNDLLYFSLEQDGSFHYRNPSVYAGEMFNLIPFSAVAFGEAILRGLPTHYTYQVAEFCIDGGNLQYLFTSDFEYHVDIDYVRGSLADGNLIAEVTNVFAHGFGALVIQKELQYAPDSVTNDTMFYARVSIRDEDTLLLFTLVDKETNNWQWAGANANPADEGVYDQVRFSVNSPAIITELLSGRFYVVEELGEDIRFEASYRQPPILWHGEKATAVITNCFAGYRDPGDNNGGNINIPHQPEIPEIPQPPSTPQTPPSPEAANVYTAWTPRDVSAPIQIPIPASTPADNYEELHEEYEPELTPVNATPTAPTHFAFMIGYAEDGTIRPQANITRAEVATIFFRLITDEYRTSIWTQTNPFADVQPGRWFNNAISTMNRGGLFAGMPLNETFNPNQPATRAEFAAMVVSYLGLGHYRVTGGNAFTDIGGHWASDAINTAYLQGWVTGFGDGTFKPDQLITRAEVAALVNRALGRLPEYKDDLLEGMIMWPDNMNTDTWYFLYIQEATNSHYHETKPNGVHETWTQLITPRNWRSLERPYSQPHDILD